MMSFDENDPKRSLLYCKWSFFHSHWKKLLTPGFFLQISHFLLRIRQNRSVALDPGWRGDVFGSAIIGNESQPTGTMDVKRKRSILGPWEGAEHLPHGEWVSFGVKPHLNTARALSPKWHMVYLACPAIGTDRDIFQKWQSKRPPWMEISFVYHFGQEGQE